MPSNEIIHGFDNYKLYFYSPALANPSPVVAMVSCYSAKTFVGNLIFFKEGTPLYENQINGNVIFLFYTNNRFADLMTTLREESPLFLRINDGNFGGMVTTNREPVGEEEGPAG